MWAAEERIPYIMLATEMEPTKQAFQLYHDRAAELGYESGPQNIGYLWKVHVDETEELAEQTGRKYVQGPSNPFLAGNEGTTNQALLQLPGLTSRRRVLPTQGRGDRRPAAVAPAPAASCPVPTSSRLPTTPLSPAPPRPSSPRFATCWKPSAPAASSSGTATAR